MFQAIDEALAEAVDYAADEMEATAAKVREKGFVNVVSDDVSSSWNSTVEAVTFEWDELSKNVNEKGVLQALNEDLSGIADHIFGMAPAGSAKQARRKPSKESLPHMNHSKDFLTAQKKLADAAADAEAAARRAMKAVASPDKDGKTAPKSRKQATVAAPAPAAKTTKPVAPAVDLMNLELEPNLAPLPRVQFPVQTARADLLDLSSPVPRRQRDEGEVPFDPNCVAAPQAGSGPGPCLLTFTGSPQKTQVGGLQDLSGAWSANAAPETDSLAGLRW